MKTEKINYRNEAKKARAQAGALALVALVLAFVFFYAITDSLLRAGIDLLAGGLLVVVSGWIGEYNRAAIVYDANEAKEKRRETWERLKPNEQGTAKQDLKG